MHSGAHCGFCSAGMRPREKDKQGEKTNTVHLPAPPPQNLLCVRACVCLCRKFIYSHPVRRDKVHVCKGWLPHLSSCLKLWETTYFHFWWCSRTASSETLRQTLGLIFCSFCLVKQSFFRQSRRWHHNWLETRKVIKNMGSSIATNSYKCGDSLLHPPSECFPDPPNLPLWPFCKLLWCHF